MNQSHPLLVETGAEILKVIRDPGYILPTLVLPVAFYSIFGIVISMGGRSNGNAAYLLATYGVYAVMGPSIFGFGIAVATERERGWLDLKRAAPVPVASYLLAKILTTLIFATLAVALVYPVAGFVGGVALPRTMWAALLAVHFSATLPFILIGLTIGLLFKSNGAVAIANLLFFGLAILGGLWIPIMVFPQVMQTLAQFLPSYHLAEIALYVIDAPGERSLLSHALAVAGMTILLLGATLLAWCGQKS